MQPSPFSELFQARAFMRLWVARVAGIMANQMLMVALGSLKLFPTLAQRDHMERPGSR